MKRGLCIPLVLLLALSLCACSFGEPTKSRTQAWATEHMELLTSCGAELLAHYPEAPKWNGAQFEVSLIKEDWVELWHGASRELIDFHSEDCRQLLTDETVGSVTAASGWVEFSLGGQGFGSQTNYDYVYDIPTDDLMGCIGYGPEFHFEPRNSGWFGQTDDPGDDNTIFWQQLDEHLYFVAEHD